ncbi:MAG: AAA family ATPase, partial [Patescibacteria group bacterium]
MIKSVSINNFRSIYETTDLKLGDITFIIGKNGAGKSTLISALYLTKQLASKGNVDEIVSKMAPFGYEIFTRGSRNSSCQIGLVVRDDKGINYKFVYSIATSGPALSYNITNESLVRFESPDNQVTI